jgi:tRNA pseudouridine55 synthase
MDFEHTMAETNIVLVDKPKGITSFDVIRILRKKLGIKKMGHAGTLDPNATGLMIIGVDKGTKLLTNFIGFDKVYEAEIKLGIKTDTGDITGNTLFEDREIFEKIFSKDHIKKIVESVKGKHVLPVSLFSAIKKGGKPLYEYAREGVKVPEPEREMLVMNADFISFDQENKIIQG